MDDQTPTPDPHRGEPIPPAQEGTRPGADPAVRPEQDEPVGPLEGLMTATGASVEEEAAEVAGEHDRDAEAILAQMGVEDEGIASGQLLGLVAATLLSVAGLAVVLIYLFYIPFQTQVDDREAGEARNTDQQILQTEALAKLTDYTRSDSTYGLPISRAMGLVAADYGSADAAGLPDSRQDWNMLSVYDGMGAAVQATPDQGEIPTVAMPIGDATEEVGVDEEVDIIESIDPDVDLETIE